MNILAVDTSGPVAGVAVLRDGEIAYEGAAVNRLTHSVNLMPMIEEALGRAGLDVSEIVSTMAQQAKAIAEGGNNTDASEESGPDSDTDIDTNSDSDPT